MPSSGTVSAAEGSVEGNHRGMEGGASGMSEDVDTLGWRVLEGGRGKGRRAIREGKAVATVLGTGTDMCGVHLNVGKRLRKYSRK